MKRNMADNYRNGLTLLTALAVIVLSILFTGCQPEVKKEKTEPVKPSVSPENIKTTPVSFRRPERIKGLKGPVKPDLLWKYKTGNEVMSSPAVDEKEHVYFGGHDTCLYVLDERGSLLKRIKTGETVTSSPLVHNNRVYWGSFDGRLYVLDFQTLETGSLLIGDWIPSSPAVTPEDKILAASVNGNLYCIEPDLSKVIWKCPTGRQRYEIQSSPVVQNGKIYVGSGEGMIFCISTDGNVLWSYKTNGPVYGTPLLDGEGNLYVGSWDKHFYSFDSKGGLRWKYITGGEITSSADILSNGDVVFGSKDGNIYCIDSSTGKNVWIFKTGSPIESSPFVDSEDRIYVGCDEGVMFALSAKGEELWRFQAKGPILSSPVVDGVGRLIFGSEDRYIYCIGSKDPN